MILSSPWVVLVAGVVAVLVGFFATPMAIRLAVRIGAVDSPDARKLEQEPIPRLGGLAVLAAFGAGLGVSLLLVDTPSGIRDPLPFFLIGSAFVFAVGALDDRQRLSALPKFAIHVLAALVAWWGGIRFSLLTVPWSGEPLDLGLFSLPATVIWIVLVTNAWNLIDGLDGLAAMLGAIASFIFAVLLTVRHQDAALLLVVPLIGGLLGFLPYNLAPARIYLGDSGSYMIGYQLALISMFTGQKGITGFAVFGPLAIIALPVADTVFAVIRRFFRTDDVTLTERIKGVFQPDRGHIHHRALTHGWSPTKAVMVLTAGSGLIGILGLVTTFANSFRQGGILLMVAAVVVIILYSMTNPSITPDGPVESDTDGEN